MGQQSAIALNQGATFDHTGSYRYTLWREWSNSAPRVGFIMLNPSRADATVNDPTIRRCIGLAKLWGFGSLEVVNLFAYRATQPQVLKQVPDPIGAENDHYLASLGDRVDRIVLAWGNWGCLMHRDLAVLALLKSNQLKSNQLKYCLGCTQQGQPRHPLYLPNTVRCQLFAERR